MAVLHRFSRANVVSGQSRIFKPESGLTHICSGLKTSRTTVRSWLISRLSRCVRLIGDSISVTERHDLRQLLFRKGQIDTGRGSIPRVRASLCASVSAGQKPRSNAMPIVQSTRAVSSNAPTVNDQRFHGGGGRPVFGVWASYLIAASHL